MSATNSTQARSTMACHDFPAWFPAMLVKELRQGMHTRGFAATLILFHLVMVVAMTTTLVGLPHASPAARAASAVTSNSFFWTLLAVMLLLVLPARALVGLRSETDMRTLDLLVLTRLTAWRIVLGKWTSLVSQGFLLLLSMLPYGLVRYFAGSVDLLEDADRCLSLMGGCALLTAAGLWCSGLPRIAAIPFAIAIAYGEGFGAFRNAAGAAATPGGSFFTMGGPWLTLFDGSVLLLFLLAASVRRIAPPAENYAPLSRLLALAALIPAPLLGMAGHGDAGRFQFGFAALLIALVCAIELSSVRRPMPIQWRSFARHGAMGRLAGVFFLPGWPSALLFMLAASVLCLGLVWSSPLFGSADRSWLARLTWLLVTGLAFPAVAFSLRSSSGSGAAYGLALGGLCAVAAVTSAFASATMMPKWALQVASVLPISGFWMALTRDTPVPWVVASQHAIGALALLVGFWRMRSYWNDLLKMDKKQRLSV